MASLSKHRHGPGPIKKNGASVLHASAIETSSMSGHHVPLRPMDHDDDDEEDRSRHHRRTPYGFIFVALFLLYLLAASIAGWALGMIYHVRGGLSQLALGSGGGD